MPERQRGQAAPLLSLTHSHTPPTRRQSLHSLPGVPSPGPRRYRRPGGREGALESTPQCTHPPPPCTALKTTVTAEVVCGCARTVEAFHRTVDLSSRRPARTDASACVRSPCGQNRPRSLSHTVGSEHGRGPFSVIGWLSGEGGCVTLVLAQQPVFMLVCCGAGCWVLGGLACSPLTVMLCHGREAAESGDIHTVNSLGRRGHTHSVPTFFFPFDCFPQVLIVMPFPLSIRRQPTAYRIQRLGN
ncbi:hypothetical protein B0T18DRAFT_12365 [Schizothecium vesticola]|uniref:Uncharacterized protein n=1 Tax=Schizothecium vesticola TaxID=314040 RepID=A0AA40F914_9PEZI|nr:hypothetical protein B0T18DRAFT_12365 [Schizothecium vesticola]